MSKMKNKKKTIVILIIGVIIGLSLSGLGTYAATTYAINAVKVSYSDNSNLGVDNVQAAIDGTCTKFNNQLTTLENSIINKIYPVGSIYISETDSTVAEVEKRFGGTWISYGSGKTLVGSGTGTDSSGTKQTFSVSNNSKDLGTYTHSHKYGFQFGSYWGLFSIESDANAGLLSYSNDSSFNVANDISGIGDYNNFQYNSGITPSMLYSSTNAVYRRIIANSSYENSLQPYITVYMYKRTK